MLNPIKHILSLIERFWRTEAASGVVLFVACLAALLWVNLGGYETYKHFIHIPLGVSFGGWELIKGLQHWVNDGLMVVFFYVVGLEIKHELLVGELASRQKAALPIWAAMGGMVVPAAFYWMLNAGTPEAHAWGVPMATDIAFAVAVLSLFSKRVPASLKVLLLAVAIVDDLGAVSVIALVYTKELAVNYLLCAAALVGTIYALVPRLASPRWFLIISGLVLWFCVFKSGVHATVAGVVLGFLTPLKARGKDTEQGPLESAMHVLHPWVNFVIMPVFAFVNSGVLLEGLGLQVLFSSPVANGIMLGLVVGKPLGVLGFGFFAVRMGWAALPRGVSWLHIAILGVLAGIGFTMALLIGHLALGGVSAQEDVAKLSILVASSVAALVGVVALSALPKSE